jgi:hypothetical protein
MKSVSRSTFERGTFQRRSTLIASSWSRISRHAAARSPTVSPFTQPCGQSFSKLIERIRSQLGGHAGRSKQRVFVQSIAPLASRTRRPSRSSSGSRS